MGKTGGRIALAVLAVLVVALVGAQSASLAPIATQVVEVLYAEADTPPAPAPISPGSPLAAPISFGNSFASISQVCLIFHFTGDLLDATDELSTSWGIGFGGSEAPQQDRGICTTTPSDTSRLLDGSDPLQVSMTNGSVTLGALVVQVSGDSTTPVGYRIASDTATYTVGQGDTVPVVTTVTDDPDAAAPPTVALTSRVLVPAGSFSTTPTSGAPTFLSNGTLSTSSSTDPGNYRLVVTGKGGGFTRTFDVTVTVTAQSAALTVNSTNDEDDGTCNATHCSLREAIDAANGDSGDSTIRFSLGSGAEIAPGALLPTINDTVDIDGALGAEAGIVSINGAGIGSGGTVFELGEGSDGSTLSNLSIHGLDLIGGRAIRLTTNDNTITSNQIFDTEDGVVVSGGAANNTIGGAADGEGNEIWDLSGIAVELVDAGSGNKVQGNTIGIDPNEGFSNGGTVGIAVSDTPGTIVGAAAGPGDGFVPGLAVYGNVVGGSEVAGSGTGGDGIVVEGTASTGTVVAFNRVGTDRTGEIDIGNADVGILVSGASGNQLGPSNVVTNNGSTATGIHIESGSGNRIVANSIFDNIGKGIELNEGANGDLSAPALRDAISTGEGAATVSGTIVGPTGDYFVEFFTNVGCDATPGGGEGRTYVGFASASITEIGTSFSGETFSGVDVADVITATVTGASTSNTSEFSNCVTVTSGGGDAGTPPILFAAVPDATPGTLGVAGLIDTGVAEAGQLFDVSFYSVPQCDPAAPKTPLGTGSDFATNDNGIAAFAKDGLTNVPAGTLVTATATPSGGSASGISNCVVADRNNTMWPTAFQLAATDTDQGFLRELGEGRWFKVPILPNSRVNISLTNLPADYDLVVFSDIQAAYDRLVGGEEYDPEAGPNLAIDDLNRASADTPTDVFNTSQYNPSSWDPTNWEPDLNTSVFSPSQWSPSQWSPSQWSATQWSPSQWSPSQWSPSQWSPSQWSPSQWSPSQWSPSQWSSSNPADPAAFTTAQTASILAVSGGTGTADERVSVNTWNNTGFMYIRVQGKNGSFDAEQPFTLDVAREGNLCSGVADQASSPTAPAGDRSTVILVDSSRMTIPQTLSTKLTTLANRPEVMGAIVDVNADSTVGALNAQADAKPSCPYAKNLVASAIKRIVDAYRATNPIEHVVVVGADAVIPFFRYPDPALLGNETMYVPPVRDDTASQASLRLGYILNQDGYASSDSISLHGNLFPVPDLAIGRLIETPEEIEGMLDAYLGTAGGVVPTPTSSLVTGYDFLTDTADVIADHFDAGLGGAANDELITDQTISPGVVSDGNDNAESYYRTRNWTGVDLRRELVNTSRDLVFLAGHFSANDALAADYKTNVLSTELGTSSANFENAIVFSAGCHTGYNIVNGDATQWTEPLDWAQAFARKQATLISGTGYQYGDTDFLAHSERIYAEFARQLRITSTAGVAEPVAVGSALLRSKQIFLETTPGLTALDEKSLLQTTLFGLPMLSVNLPQGRIVEAPDSSVVGGLTGVATGPGAELGLEFADLGVGPGLTPGQKQLKNTDSTNGPLATWLSGPDGVAVRPTQPILPLDSLNVTVPDTALRGVGFRSGSYTDTPNVTPLTAAPATELRGVHAPFFTDVFFPTQPWTANYFGALEGGSGTTRLHATPAQHRSTPSATRRSFGNLDLRLFYSDNVSSYCAGTNPLMLAPCPGDVAIAPALAAPPTITGVQTSYDGLAEELTFEARALGHLVAGIQSVWVTWTVPPGASGGGGSWQSLDLARDEDDPTLWTGTLGGVTNASAVHFIVQAVNGVGRVTIDDNVGAFYRHGSIPGPLAPGVPEPAATTMTFVTPPPSSIAFGQSFPVTIELTAGGIPVSGKVVRIGLGGNGLPAVTNGSGRASVDVRAAVAPSTYAVSGSFAGDSTHAASDVSADIDVVAQPTALTLTGTLRVEDPLVATLKTTTTPPAFLHQRNIFVIIRGTGVTEVFIGKTDPQGRVELPASLLTTLPPREYTVDAYFNGVNVPGVLVMAPDNVDYGPSTAQATFASWLPFSGFFGLSSPPAYNSVKAGTAVPVKFSLGGNRGLSIFAAGFPMVGTIPCNNPTATPTGLVAAQSNGLSIDAKNDRYTYDWKTVKSWRGCRALVIRFADGTERRLLFRF